jgi:hypothetical protein
MSDCSTILTLISLLRISKNSIMRLQMGTLVVALNMCLVDLFGSLGVSAAFTEVGVQPEPICSISDSIEVHENFLSPLEVARLSQADVNGAGVGGGVFHGKAFLSREIIARLPRNVETQGSKLESCNSAGDGAMSIRTKILLSSSHLHSDSHDPSAEVDIDDGILSSIGANICRSPILHGKVKDEVSFIFLNTPVCNICIW